MARASAITAVAGAVLTALNVTAFRTLCPGGVYRTTTAVQSPPYCVIGPCSERPMDALGQGYGSIVSVPIRVVAPTGDAIPEDRHAAILSKALALLDEPVALTASGWTVRQVLWTTTVPAQLELADGSTLPALQATVEVWVKA